MNRRANLYSIGLVFALSAHGSMGCSGEDFDEATIVAAPGQEDEVGRAQAALSTDEPYFVRLHVIVTRNTGAADDGAVSSASISSMLATLNTVYTNAPLRFQFDPDSDYERVADTQLNEDFPRNSQGNYIYVSAANNPNVTAQNQRAQQYPGKAVIYFRDYTAELAALRAPDDEDWRAASNFAGYGEFSYARMQKTAPTLTVGHELGHYFNLAHTEIGDGDGLSDTPPDPSPSAFVEAGLDPCGAIGSVTVDGVRYTPARDNIMSYYGCTSMTYRISNQQASRVRATIETGLYAPMVAQPARYDAVFYKPTTAPAQSEVYGWELAHVQTLNSTNAAAGKNLIALLSYDIGGGQRRYDAVWQQGAPATTYIAGWEQAHFVAQDSAVRGQGYRLLTVQSYATPAGRRYDAVWRKSTLAQQLVVGWERAHVFNLASELFAQGYVLSGMHSYDIGGGVRRYDAFFHDKDKNSSWVQGFRQDHVANHEAQLGSGWAVAAFETYEQAPRQVRYDAAWEPTNRPHLTALNYGRKDLQRKVAKMKEQGYVIKSLRVRND